MAEDSESESSASGEGLFSREAISFAGRVESALAAHREDAETGSSAARAVPAHEAHREDAETLERRQPSTPTRFLIWTTPTSSKSILKNE